jgi:hypothetical protein
MITLRQIIAQEVFRVSATRWMIAGNPAPNYPPANINGWMKTCIEHGRKDLADKIQKQWEAVLQKYPKARLNWGMAVTVGGNSIKKNVFGRKDFHVWFQEQLGEPVAVAPIPEVKPSVPAIAIPKPNETPEDWRSAAAKTTAMLMDLEKAFGTAEEMVDYLQKEVKDIERKIKEYGPGGRKEFTKSGAPSKFSLRVPKWEAELGVYQQKLDEVDAQITASKKQTAKAKVAYDNAPVTTVAYEEGMQDALDVALERILNMSDLEKQQQMLVKFQKMAQQLDKQKTASLKEAGIFDTLFSAFDKFVSFLVRGWKSVMNWARGVVQATNDVSYWATSVGR